MKTNELLKGSLVLLSIFMIVNVLNYFFQFFMARSFTLEDYGIFAALVGILYILSVPSESIQLISSRYTSILSNKNPNGVKSLILKMNKKGLILSLIVFALYIPIAFFLSWFLNIQIWLLILTGASIFFVFLSPVNRGVLQGQKKFSKMGTTFLIEALIKIILGSLLVYFGFRVYGAMLGIIIAMLVAFLISFMFVREHLKVKVKEEIKIGDVYSYSFSVFMSLLVIFLMFSLDILLVKSFFPGDVAGKYAVISLLGKTIFFATSPINKAMFPLMVNKDNQDARRTLKNATKFVLLIGILTIILFAVFPDMIIKILFGEKYLGYSNLLWIMGTAFLILSLANLVIYYRLSIGKIKRVWVLAIFPVIQIVLSMLFIKSLLEFSIILIISYSLLLLGVLILTKNER